MPGIDWPQFKTLSRGFSGRRIRLTYHKGMLEIMSPISREREVKKGALGLLLEAWFRSRGVRFYRTGGFTLEAEGQASGEPDESYCLHELKEVPDLLIEVIVSSGRIDTLEVYKPFHIPEVWFWREDRLRVFVLQDGDYREAAASVLLPDLDLALVQRSARCDDQFEAVAAFERALAEG